MSDGFSSANIACEVAKKICNLRTKTNEILLQRDEILLKETEINYNDIDQIKVDRYKQSKIDR